MFLSLPFLQHLKMFGVRHYCWACIFSLKGRAKFRCFFMYPLVCAVGSSSCRAHSCLSFCFVLFSSVFVLFFSLLFVFSFCFLCFFCFLSFPLFVFFQIVFQDQGLARGLPTPAGLAHHRVASHGESERDAPASQVDFCCRSKALDIFVPKTVPKTTFFISMKKY